MQDNPKGELLSKLMEVYPIPVILHKLNEAINDPEVKLYTIEKIVKYDQYFTLKLIKLANSAYYGSVKITTVRDAVKLLGFDTVKQLSIHTAVMKAMEFDKGMSDFTLARIWKHSVAVAVASKIIANELYVDDTEHFFTAGILHDIGMMIEHKVFADQFDIILKQVVKNDERLVDVEKECFGYDHSEISCMIIKNWELPDKLYQWVKYHHNPLEAEDSVRLPASILRLADIVSIRNDYSVPYGKIDAVERDVMNYLEIDNDCLTNIITLFNVEINNVLPYFEV